MNLRLPFLSMPSIQQPLSQPSHIPHYPVVVVGLNGALQKRFVLAPNESLVSGNVHRAVQVQNGVGGKGQDVAIALHCLSEYTKPQILQFLGTGSAGDAVHQLLIDRFGETVMTLTVRSSKDLRTCTSIVAKDDTTELVEPSGEISSEELQQLFQKASEVANRARSLCIMGSMPPGCPSDTYAKLYAKLAGPSTICVVDSVTGIDHLLKTANDLGINAGPIIFKVNASELCNLSGAKKSKSESGGVDKKELADAVLLFVSKYSSVDATSVLAGLAVTDGRHPAYFVCFDNEQNLYKIFRLPIQRLPENQTLYPIGAGDAVAAGFLAAWSSIVAPNADTCSLVPKDCLRLLMDRVVEICSTTSLSSEVASAISAFSFGLACGSASCLKEENSVLDTSDVLRLFRTTKPPELVHQNKLREGGSSHQPFQRGADVSQDLFACFDVDDDRGVGGDVISASDNGVRPVGGIGEPSAETRDPGNGVLAFHRGTEQALLNYVKLQHNEFMDSFIDTDVDSSACVAQQISQAESVLNSIDFFCKQRHWMMHIGPEKSAVLRNFIADCLLERINKNSPSFCIVELGTYCGYSAIFFVKTVLEELKQRLGLASEFPPEKFHLYTVEVVKQNAQVAQELIQLTGLAKYISILLLQPEKGDTLAAKLKQEMDTTCIDFLFLDHDKSRYLQDLKTLESSGMIQQGTRVAADNVIFAGINDYREYMKHLAEKGIVETRLHEGFLEYSECERTLTGTHSSTIEKLKDGIELSVYL